MSAFSDGFETRTAQFIDREGLLHRRAPVVVALSGGADSVALLDVLLSLGYDCRAAHCNFHLRGEESMRDMNHCRKIAATLGADLYVRDFDVAARMQARPRESVEMACRELRFDWFASLLDREGAQAVAVGHHREDRIETFMLNLMRGTGIAGLTAMRPRSASVVRPLLQFSRAEIEQYLADRGLTFITDSSNASDVHRRNRLRNNILPALADAFPGAYDAILRTIANLESAGAIYSEAIAAKKTLYLDGNRIDISALSAEPEKATVLLEILRPLGFTYSQVCDMLDARTATGARFISTDSKVVANLSRGAIVLTDGSRIVQPETETYPVNIRHDITAPLAVAVSTHGIAEFRPSAEGPHAAYFDSDILEGNPVFALRRYRRGDRMTPFGSSKSKLVSDLFANARYTLADKESQWLLTRNDVIIWAPGLKNSALFTLGPSTKTYIRMEMRPAARDKKA